MISLAFVCTGNICRSPLAEAVMRGLVERAGLATRISVESAGTEDWNAGAPPHGEARIWGGKAGVVVRGTARQVTAADLRRLTHVVGMEDAHVQRLQELGAEGAGAAMHLLRDFDPLAAAGDGVPDPYHGGAPAWREVLEILQRSCPPLLEHLRDRHGLR